MINYSKKIVSVTFALILSFLSFGALAETAVIVNPANDSTLSKDDISNLYLGKSKTFSNGDKAVCLDREEGSDIRVGFLDTVVGKRERQMKSYWARLIFTGKGIPPTVIETDAEVVELVGKNKDHIGFVDASAVDGSVKVILKF